MKSEQELNFIANRFLDVAKVYLDRAKDDFGMDATLCLPLSRSDFDATVEAMSQIQEIGKTRGISAKINDASDSRNEYGHDRVIRLERI